MAKLDPQIVAHLEWLGYVKPTGLVVSAPALVRAGAILDGRDADGQRLLRASVGAPGPSLQERPAPPYLISRESPPPRIADFRAFAASVFGWSFSPKGFAGTSEATIPPELELVLPEVGVTFRPDFAVRELDPPEGAPPWQLVVQVLGEGEEPDREPASSRGGLSPHARMERLLRHTGVPAGLIVSGDVLRLLSAPRGESSGWIDFRVADMVETAGRPICAAMRLLLSEQRLLALPRHQRLAALLADSRRFQNEVSEKLAAQVLEALYELLRGFEAAQVSSRGALLAGVVDDDPDHVYRGLLTVILRIVFLLYAEERDMLPQDETFLRGYSIAGLFDRLREDAALNPDTMDQRYGGWAQLVALFRLIHDGGQAPGMRLPSRRGNLFDPDRFTFLEGRAAGAPAPADARIEPPRVPDGTVHRVLEKLLVLDGERISYRALDVEQIGSVYETMMGFRLKTATGPSIALRAAKKGGAPVAIDLAASLGQSGTARAKAIEERSGRKLGEAVKRAVAAAATLDDLHAALDPVVDRAATPDVVPAGAMVLEPSEERRRSGSHYTPRELTEPIVRTTLEPILARLRGHDAWPRPESILDLKVCDPAMGSGAFLVEACRYLGDALVESWRVHGGKPRIPPDEDEVVHARRLVAQRCLYGVDRNPVAVDLARMSLWLATLARDHALTFIDHALRHGDSLVGLSRSQIEAFHWEADVPSFQAGFEAMRAREHLTRVALLRRSIREAGEDMADSVLRERWGEVQSELDDVRLLGDLVVAAYFSSEKPKERERKRREYADAVVNGDASAQRAWLHSLRRDDPPLAPFHWPIEFPEVFDREQPGFDAFVGNPPFAGKNSVAGGNLPAYPDWLKELHPESHGNADLVAHFFRRAFDLTREGGALGLIATNTIAQGDTRSTGLRWICTHGGEIYAARKRVKWPGMAAVVVSVVHVSKGPFAGTRRLDGREVETITAFLFHRGGHDDPVRLAANAGKSFVGSYVLGMGFTFDDTDTKGAATPIAEMHRLLALRPENREVIFPYIGGEEVNTSPTHAHHRYVINFSDRSEEACRASWPELMAIVEQKVRPTRQTQGSIVNPARWWMFARSAADLVTATFGLRRVLVISQVTQHIGFAFVPLGMVYSHRLYVFALDSFFGLTLLQSRVHEVWARFLGSSLEDRFMYAAADCFETFPMPAGQEGLKDLEATGRVYYENRAELMVANDEGLTKTYNRFHDPDERDSGILKLREVHASMDRAVLDAYGWTDVPTTCDFYLDYEIDEENWGDRKKPWRYRWPDDVRDEVLARLIALNAERAREEALAGAATGSKRRRKSVAKASDLQDPDLFA